MKRKIKMKPVEVQRSRKKGYRQPHNTKYIGRGTDYGNPYSLDKYTREQSLALYRKWIDKKLKTDPAFLEPLRGWNLSCFCKIGMPCHRQILLELANKER